MFLQYKLFVIITTTHTVLIRSSRGRVNLQLHCGKYHTKGLSIPTVIAPSVPLYTNFSIPQRLKKKKKIARLGKDQYLNHGCLTKHPPPSQNV